MAGSMSMLIMPGNRKIPLFKNIWNINISNCFTAFIQTLSAILCETQKKRSHDRKKTGMAERKLIIVR